MSEESVETCLKDQALFDKLSADEEFAHKVLKVHATPTFFINAERIKGAISFEEFDKRIKQLELIINLKTSKALGGRPFADTARADRRGDRIEMPFAAAHESVVGTKRTWPDVRLESASGEEQTS